MGAIQGQGRSSGEGSRPEPGLQFLTRDKLDEHVGLREISRKSWWKKQGDGSRALGTGEGSQPGRNRRERLEGSPREAQSPVGSREGTWWVGRVPCLSPPLPFCPDPGVRQMRTDKDEGDGTGTK